MSKFSIDLCVGWLRVAECNEGTFDGIVRNLAVGEWQLSGYVAALQFKNGYTLANVDTVRVVRDATIVFAGYVAPVQAGVGGLKLTRTTDGEHFTLSGPDAWAVPGQRIAYPTPSTVPPWAASWDVRTGLASTVAAGYVSDNAGLTALADRKITGLTVVDGLAGMSGSWSARLQPLDDLVIRVCRDGGIVCRLVMAFSGALQMVFGSARDRRTTCVLSDQGDLTNIERQIISAAANYVVAGGQGVLTARTFAASGVATGAARREVFANQSSLSSSPEVQQAADTAVSLGGPVLAIRAEITDVAAGRLQYLVDYDIGDTISVEINQVRYPVVIESVKFHVGQDRAVIRPQWGNAAPDLVAGLVRDVNNLQSRFDTQIA